GEHGERVVAVFPLDARYLLRHAPDRVLVRQRAKAARGSLGSLVGMQESVRMGLLQVTLHAFGAEHAAVEGELVPRLDPHHGVRLGLELEPALLPAEATMGLDVAVRLDPGVEGEIVRIGPVRPERANRFELERGFSESAHEPRWSGVKGDSSRRPRARGGLRRDPGWRSEVWAACLLWEGGYRRAGPERRGPARSRRPPVGTVGRSTDSVRRWGRRSRNGTRARARPGSNPRRACAT